MTVGHYRFAQSDWRYHQVRLKLGSHRDSGAGCLKTDDRILAWLRSTFFAPREVVRIDGLPAQKHQRDAV